MDDSRTPRHAGQEIANRKSPVLSWLLILVGIAIYLLIQGNYGYGLLAFVILLFSVIAIGNWAGRQGLAGPAQRSTFDAATMMGPKWNLRWPYRLLLLPVDAIGLFIAFIGGNLRFVLAPTSRRGLAWLQSLLSSPDDFDRWRAVRMLSQKMDDERARAIAPLLRDRCRWVRAAASKSLIPYPQHLRPFVDSGDDAIWLAAAVSLHDTGEDVDVPQWRLDRILNVEAKADPLDAGETFTLLARLPIARVANALDTILEWKIGDAGSALSAVAEQNSPESKDYIVAKLHSANSKTVWGALLATSHLGPEVIEEVRPFETDPRPEIQRIAKIALGRLNAKAHSRNAD